MCYDRFGRVVRKVQSVTGGSTLATASVYDHAGNVVSMTYPSGAIVSYLRNANGQISSVAAKPTSGATQITVVSAASYLPFGPLTSLTFGNGRLLTKAYDADYGIDKVSDNAASNPVSEDYSLDAAGHVTGVTERTNVSTTVARNYTYDGLDRLTAEKNGASAVESFAYNGTGDRTSKIVGGTTNNYTYGSTNHWLTNVSGVSARGYDAMGNTANFGTAYVFTYDDHDRLRTFTLNGVLSRTYYYNALGQRVLRVANAAPSSSEQLVYDEAGHLLGEYSTSGARVAEFVWLDDTLVGILKSAEGGTYQFVETDALGTPRAVVNPVNNAIVWRWDITPTSFGDHNPINDPDGNGISYTLNLRYPGQFNDGLDFINYNGFRDYYANSGRYLESDPIGLGGGVSTYGYVGGDPLNSFDPHGLEGYDKSMFAPGSREYEQWDANHPNAEKTLCLRDAILDSVVNLIPVIGFGKQVALSSVDKIDVGTSSASTIAAGAVNLGDSQVRELTRIQNGWEDPLDRSGLKLWRGTEKLGNFAGKLLSVLSFWFEANSFLKKVAKCECGK